MTYKEAIAAVLIFGGYVVLWFSPIGIGITAVGFLALLLWAQPKKPEKPEDTDLRFIPKPEHTRDSNCHCHTHIRCMHCGAVAERWDLIKHLVKCQYFTKGAFLEGFTPSAKTITKKPPAKKAVKKPTVPATKQQKRIKK